MRLTTPAAFLALALLTGCATAEAPRLTIAEPFNAEAGAWASMPGHNTIKGDALLRTRGGDVKTCAGLDVELIPATPYTTEYVTRRYGGPSGGYADRYSVLRGVYVLAPGFFAQTVKKVCTAQGGFAFEGLADGDYFVTATVTWEVPGADYSLQGGEITKRVSVSGGEVKAVTLTAN